MKGQSVWQCSVKRLAFHGWRVGVSGLFARLFIVIVVWGGVGVGD